ncbi:MAG: hypothetical protein Q8K20_17715 [Gemmobacter sp.]|nr:hypothetical protein [Gemmobacter sp.]
MGLWLEERHGKASERRATPSARAWNFDGTCEGPDHITRHIIPDAITPTASGVEVLNDEALLSLLHAAFHGVGAIDEFGVDLERHRLKITGMRGNAAKLGSSWPRRSPIPQ